MRVLMVLDPYAGHVVDWATPVAEVLIGTGEAEAYTAPEPEMGVAVVELPSLTVVSEEPNPEYPELDGEGWFVEVVDESTLGPVVVAQPELDTFTVAQLEDMGDVHGSEAVDIDGTGADGGVLKADWVRVLEAARDAGPDQ